MSNEHVFNSSLEAGVRAIRFLNSYFPESMDFYGLMKIDFILVNSGDFSGPESLHPVTPNRKGEYFSRREKVRSGLDLMMKFGLVEVDYTNSGVAYKASEHASPYLELMKSNYSLSLSLISEWLAKELKENGFEQFDIALGSKVF